MRKVFILFIFCYLTAAAQSWCPAGAEWHYRLNQTFPTYYNGYIKLNNTGTVSIGGQTCNNLKGIFYGQLFGSSAPNCTCTTYVPDIQTYRNNEVVYVYNTKTLVFDTLTDFNATIGAKWRAIEYPVNTSTSSPCPSPYLL